MDRQDGADDAGGSSNESVGSSKMSKRKSSQSHVGLHILQTGSEESAGNVPVIARRNSAKPSLEIENSDVSGLMNVTKDAYDFSVKVVNNAHKVLEYSKGVHLQLKAWKRDMLKKMGTDKEKIEMLKGYVETLIQSRKDLETTIEDLKHEEYDSLKSTLDKLATIETSNWMQCSDYSSEHAEKGVLMDFVDEGEIKELTRKWEAKRGELTTATQIIQNHIDILENQRLELLMTADQQILENVTGEKTSVWLVNVDKGEEIFAHVKMEMEKWLKIVSAAVHDQSEIVKSLSSGSLGLASLHDYLLNHTDDASGILDSVDSSEYQDITTRIIHFTQSTCFKEHHTTSLQFENMNVLVMTSQKHFKLGLESIQTHYKAILGPSESMKKLWKDYPSRITEQVEEKISYGKHAIGKAEETLKNCHVVKQKIQEFAQDFQKLDIFYNRFVQAQEKATDELKRRWKALAAIEQLARKQQNEINELVKQELGFRATFHAEHGSYLPNDLCPALNPQLSPTSFQYVITNPDDAQFLHNCIAKLDNSSVTIGNDEEFGKENSKGNDVAGESLDDKIGTAKHNLETTDTKTIE